MAYTYLLIRSILRKLGMFAPCMNGHVKAGPEITDWKSLEISNTLNDSNVQD